MLTRKLAVNLGSTISKSHRTEPEHLHMSLRVSDCCFTRRPYLKGESHHAVDRAQGVFECTICATPIADLAFRRGY